MNLTPKVIDKTLKSKEFDAVRIYESLLIETDLFGIQAKFITQEVTKFIISISGDIKFITAPMIREIINVILLQHGYEKERLQYTRIGLPYYDLENLYENNHKPIWLNIERKVSKHTKKEFYNVKKLIDDLEEKNLNEIKSNKVQKVK